MSPPRPTHALAGVCLSVALLACTSSNSGVSPEASTDTESGSAADGAGGGTSGGGTCRWPSSLDDAGPGACTVGRAYVECTYPSGVVCDGGPSAFGSGGLTMLCISNDPTSCMGCSASAGTATCTDRCSPNEYAVSCGGPPLPPVDGGAPFEYQDPPDACVGAGVTPGGNAYYCCPCE